MKFSPIVLRGALHKIGRFQNVPTHGRYEFGRMGRFHSSEMPYSSKFVSTVGTFRNDLFYVTHFCVHKYSGLVANSVEETPPHLLLHGGPVHLCHHDRLILPRRRRLSRRRLALEVLWFRFFWNQNPRYLILESIPEVSPIKCDVRECVLRMPDSRECVVRTAHSRECVIRTAHSVWENIVLKTYLVL